MDYHDKLIDNPNYNGITLKKLLESSMDALPFMQGKGEKKEGENETEWDNGSAAFLGPQLWEKTIPCNNDLKFEYMDLDEFLNENELEDEFFHKNVNNQIFQEQKNQAPVEGSELPQTPKRPEVPFGSPTVTDEKSQTGISDCSPLKRTLSTDSSSQSCSTSFDSKSDDEGPGFDPRKRTFSVEELKPQPMMKKSRKQYVPNDMKDDKYWARRRKNNLAAKRSRDARRVKENQIVLRASFLEKENGILKEELEQTRQLLETMKKKLAAYEGTQ